MKGFVTIVTAAAIVAVATWAYRVNYDTRAQRNQLLALQAELSQAEERLQVLHVEWAYLNRPDRLQTLVAAHADQLGLMPADPGHFGRIEEIPFPSKPMPEGSAPRRPALPMTLEEALVFTAGE